MVCNSDRWTNSSDKQYNLVEYTAYLKLARDTVVAKGAKLLLMGDNPWLHERHLQKCVPSIFNPTAQQQTGCEGDYESAVGIHDPLHSALRELARPASSGMYFFDY